jgi:hypothetical protein
LSDGPDDLPPGPIDQHPVQGVLYSGQLQGDLLPEVAITSEVIGTDTADGTLSLRYQGVKLVV